MNFEDVLKIAAAVITAVGGSGAIILGLSSWIGKIWADRLLEKEKHRLSIEIEKAKRDFDLFKEKNIQTHSDKLAAYRTVADMVAKMLAVFDSFQDGRVGKEAVARHFDDFNEQRIRVYGYLAMIAPQEVMDAQDELIDYLLQICHGVDTYEWHRVREKAIKLINTIRLDIGFNNSKIQYNGKI